MTSLVAGVGAGGDFGSINAALEDLTERFHPYRSAGVDVGLHLLSGFTMGEQVHLRDVDYSWIKVRSDDAEVPIDRSTQDGNGAWRADRATLPVFECKFRMGTEGTTDNVRVFNVFFGSRLYIGAGGGAAGACDRVVQIHDSLGQFDSTAVIEDATGLNLRLANAARLFADSATIRNAANENVAVGSSSVAQLGQSTITGAGGPNVSIAPGPVLVNLNSADLSNPGTRAVSSAQGAIIDLRSATAPGVLAQEGCVIDATGATTRQGASDDPSDTRVLNGGTIIANSVVGGVSQAPNIQTADGLIIDSAETSENDGVATFDGDGSTTDFDISHGLTVGSPSVVKVEPESADAGKDRHISRRDASIIRVRFATAPPSGTGNVVFNWYARR